MVRSCVPVCWHSCFLSRRPSYRCANYRAVLANIGISRHGPRRHNIDADTAVCAMQALSLRQVSELHRPPDAGAMVSGQTLLAA